MLKSWESLPASMRTEAVRPYYETLAKRQGTLRRKRILDICGSFVLTILLSPIMLVIAIAIKAEDGGPVFFRRKESQLMEESSGFLNSAL